MFITLRNFLIYSYRDKFLYWNWRPIWSSLRCLLMLIFTPGISRKQCILSLCFVRFLPVKKEGLVPLSSWQLLNSVRPAQPAVNVRNKTCARHWVNFYFIIMEATLQNLCWKCIFDVLCNGMCHYCGHLAGRTSESIIFLPVSSLWWPYYLLQKLSLVTICGLAKEQQQD